MKTFAQYHPIVNIVFFVCLFTCVMLTMHPVITGIFLVVGITYLKDFKGIFVTFFVALVAVLVNVFFNHRGVTPLLELPGGNMVTLEAIVYGLLMGSVLITVIIWFSSLNQVMTSDKYIYLFGKTFPKTGLLLSMTLRFFTRFKKQFEKTYEARRSIKREGRLKELFTVLGIMISWSLERGIHISESMNARGYGSGKRTSYIRYRITTRDIVVIIAELLCAGIILFEVVSGRVSVQIYPAISISYTNISSILSYVAAFVLAIIPALLARRKDERI